MFNLRKDLTNINYNKIINNLQVALYKEQVNMGIARNYINTLIDSDIAINNNINKKADISYVDNGIDEINNNINQKADISYVDNAIDEINIYPCDSYGGAIGNTSLSSLNNALNSAILQINNIKLNVIEEITYEKNNALAEIHMLSENVSNQINGLNDSIKEDLLRRIDYLFEMFYHANSDTIIELYPL